MKNVIKMSVAAAVMMTVGTVSAQAADGINLFENIKVKGEIRPRYELVDGDRTSAVGSPDKSTSNANAVTNRFVLGVGADIAGLDWLSVYGEMTDVHSTNSNYHDGTGANGTSKDLNTVVDAEQTRLTQAYIDVKFDDILLRSGRQMINLDNQRFIGAVGWRQMPQTFDGFLAAYTGVENLSLAASYITQVNTVKDSTDGKDITDTRTVVLHAKYKIADWMTVTAYDYMLGSGTGVNDGFGNGVGSDTLGLALTGKPKISDGLVLNYRAEYATMMDPSMDNGNISSYQTGGPAGVQSLNDNYDADYYNLEVGANLDGFLAQIGYEYQSGMTYGEGADYRNLGGDNKTFSTALGTNHAFSGWADVFLSTPEQGLEDLNLMVGYKSKELGLFKVVYHKFDSAEESISYGSEIDLLYKRAIPGVKGLTGMLKAAFYSADDDKGAMLNGVVAPGNPKYEDVSKFWVMLDYKFSN